MTGPFYFGRPEHPATAELAGRTLFGWYDAPENEARGAVLLCGPIGDDSVRAHRPLRHLAERLVRAGFGVLRFDYHGTGDSEADERSPDRVTTWLEDVRLAVDELRARSGVAAVSVVGVRLGGTLALKVAREAGIDRIVLWGAYGRGAAFATASTQFYKLHKRMEPKGFAGGPPSRTDGEEVFGFLLTHATLAELKALDVRSPEGAASPSTSKSPRLRRALLVGDGSGRSEQEILEGHLRSLDVRTDVQSFPGCLQFLVEIPHKSRLPDPAIDGIVTWLADEAPAPAAVLVEVPSPPAAPIAQAGPAGEEPVRFGQRHPLFGIHHPAHPPSPTTAAAKAARVLPPIILASAGTVHRIGPHRFYVNLARRWASLGFSVLRVDLSGIGDSPAADDGIENVTYPRDGYEDLGEAMDFLAARLGATQFIVAGLCSGGDFAFQMGIRDPRVVSSLILNPRTFCVNDLARVETGNLESVVAAAERAVRARGGGAAGAGGTGDGQVVSVPESLRGMALRGVDTFLVVSEEDPGVHYVDTHWGDAMRALVGLPGFAREDIPGSDHNFTSLWSQERASEVVLAHLTHKYLAGS